MRDLLSPYAYLSSLHERVIRHPFPEYSEKMKSIMPDRREFDAHLSHTGSLHRCYLASLTSILGKENPALKILELGTATGVSAAFMMEALGPEGSLTTIEIRDLDRAPDSPWRFDHLAPWKDDPRLRRILGDVLDPEIHGPIPAADLLFVDTDHSFEQAVREWQIYRLKVVPYGIAAFDDIHFNDGMERFWDSIDLPKFDTGRVIHEAGFGLVLGGQAA
jgi:predicted O-methyltransferase YrrM